MPKTGSRSVECSSHTSIGRYSFETPALQAGRPQFACAHRNSCSAIPNKRKSPLYGLILASQSPIQSFSPAAYVRSLRLYAPQMLSGGILELRISWCQEARSSPPLQIQAIYPSKQLCAYSLSPSSYSSPSLPGTPKPGPSACQTTSAGPGVALGRSPSCT